MGASERERCVRSVVPTIDLSAGKLESCALIRLRGLFACAADIRVVRSAERGQAGVEKRRERPDICADK